MAEGKLKNIDLKQILILAAMFLVAAIFWDTLVIYPIKLFVVILHEMSHGLMAEAVGGDIVNIQIDQRVGGYCSFTCPVGFFPSFLVASAGYLGSLVWGGLILIIASRTNKDKYLSLIIGLILLWLTWYVIKTGEIFGIVFCGSFAILMIVSFKLLPDIFHDYMLKFFGLTSCMYVILDIKSDLIDRSNIGSDADRISDMTGIPSMAIGIIWLIIALVTIFFILKISFKRKKGSIQSGESI